MGLHLVPTYCVCIDRECNCESFFALGMATSVPNEHNSENINSHRPKIQNTYQHVHSARTWILIKRLKQDIPNHCCHHVSATEKRRKTGKKQHTCIWQKRNIDKNNINLLGNHPLASSKSQASQVKTSFTSFQDVLTLNIFFKLIIMAWWHMYTQDNNTETFSLTVIQVAQVQKFWWANLTQAKNTSWKVQ